MSIVTQQVNAIFNTLRANGHIKVKSEMLTILEVTEEEYNRVVLHEQSVPREWIVKVANKTQRDVRHILDIS